MRSHFTRTWLALAAMVAATGAAAQTRPDGPTVLNVLELQRLVAADTFDSHEALNGHFTALADAYTSSAETNAARSRGAIGNPNRWWPSDPGDKWTRLADRDRAAARVTRALAIHHALLATGHPSVLPPGSARFHGGEGAREPTRPELRALAAQARTRGDHLELEEYYLLVAAREGGTIDRHTAMAIGFRGTPRRTGSGDAAVRCDRAVARAREEQDYALIRAQIHRQLASVGSR